VEPKKVDRRDGATGGGGRVGVWSLDPQREAFGKASLNEGPGFRVRVSPKSGWTIVELDIQADPRKDAKWQEEMRATIGESRYRREYLRDWTISTQSPYYSEYLANGGDETFVKRILSLGRTPLLAGLDFGVRRPALVVAQANARKTRLFVFREWSPIGITAVPFMEVCEWLMGELPKRELGPSALIHVLDLERRADEGTGPAVPWFIDPPQVVRYSSQEALRISQEVADESRERRVIDIWAARGFPLNVHYAQVKGGGDVVRHLLRTPRAGRLPYFVIDPSCKLLREGLGGGYTFKRPTRENPMPSEPTKDGKYEHTQDCLKYIASNAIDMKAVDDGTDEPRVEISARRTEPKQPKRDEYSRAGNEDDGEGFSSAFASARNPRAYYERETY